MELAAAPIGKMGQQEKIFSSPKRLTMEKKLAAADSSSPLQRQQSRFRGRSSSFDGKSHASTFGCYICKGPHLQRNCPKVAGQCKIVCWRCGEPGHLVARCTKPRRKLAAVVANSTLLRRSPAEHTAPAVPAGFATAVICSAAKQERSYR